MQIGDFATAAVEEERVEKQVCEVEGVASWDKQVVDPVALAGTFVDLHLFEHPLEGMVRIEFRLQFKK